MLKSSKVVVSGLLVLGLSFGMTASASADLSDLAKVLGEAGDLLEAVDDVWGDDEDTADDDMEWEDILKISDSGDARIAAFVNDNIGEEVELDCYIDSITDNPETGKKDYVLYAGTAEKGKKEGPKIICRSCDIADFGFDEAPAELPEKTDLELEGDIVSYDDTQKAVILKPTSSEIKAAVSDSDIRPDFKAAMDSYEAFYKEYCEFLKSYDSSDLGMLAKYSELMTRLGDMEESFSEWDEDDMTSAELAYYIDVNARVQKMLLEVA